jgi:SAM-dependent methyltransferase
MTDGAATFHAADVYDRHVGRYGAALAAAHVVALGVRPGDRALDVGCGPGALTNALAGRLGADRVCAVDPSSPFVEACRERVPGVDVRVASAEDLPDFGVAFDVSSSQLVLNFMTDPHAGVRALVAATRPGGTVGSAVWDYAGEMHMLRTFWDAALALDADAPDEGRTMRYCSPSELSSLWHDCELGDVETRALVVEARYDDFADYWSPFPRGIAPSGAYCASLDPDRQEALRRECFHRLGSPAGPFTLTARAWFVRGTA